MTNLDRAMTEKLRTGPIIRAFWHKSRKAFLPRTTAELAAKLECDQGKLSEALTSLQRHGLLVTTRAKGIWSWDVTPKGAEMLAVQQ